LQNGAFRMKKCRKSAGFLKARDKAQKMAENAAFKCRRSCRGNAFKVELSD